MKYAICYSSKTGNTKLVAQWIEEELKGKEVIYVGKPDPKAEDADIILVGSWTDKGTFDAEMLSFLEETKNKKLFLFGTAGFGGGSAYFDQILDRVKEHVNPSNEIIGTFYCQGKMLDAVKARYEAMQKANPEEKKWASMIANFEKAKDHPNESDHEALIQVLKNQLKMV